MFLQDLPEHLHWEYLGTDNYHWEYLGTDNYHWEYLGTDNYLLWDSVVFVCVIIFVCVL